MKNIFLEGVNHRGKRSLTQKFLPRRLKGRKEHEGLTTEVKGV
jgi:hypothetical protein